MIFSTPCFNRRLRLLAQRLTRWRKQLFCILSSLGRWNKLCSHSLIQLCKFGIEGHSSARHRTAGLVLIEVRPMDRAMNLMLRDREPKLTAWSELPADVLGQIPAILHLTPHIAPGLLPRGATPEPPLTLTKKLARTRSPLAPAAAAIGGGGGGARPPKAEGTEDAPHCLLYAR
jgi:hypothetical protein